MGISERTRTLPRSSRRAFIGWGAGALAAYGLARAAPPGVARAAASPVAIARCPDYDVATVTESLDGLFDRIGGVGRLVNGKCVTIKVNLIGPLGRRFHGLSPGSTYQTHFNLVLATADLLRRAGARRLRLVESLYDGMTPEDLGRIGGWDWNALDAAGGDVSFVDTRNRGDAKQYARLSVPGGGLLFPAYDLNPAYVDTDVFVSLGKMKDHVTAGVSLAVKNSFGILPLALYGNDAGTEDAVRPRVDMLHDGRVSPPAGVPKELDSRTPRRPDWRVPRLIVDLLRARPIDLAIIDAVETITGGEGPWVAPSVRPVKPKLLLAGRDPVATDAVAAAIMGYDPQARPGVFPFTGDNYIQLAAAAGLGSNDPDEIDIRGLDLREASFPFDGPPSLRDQGPA